MLVEAGSQQALHIVDQATLPDILWGGNGSANHAVEEEQHCFFDGNRIVEVSGDNGFEEAALQQISLGVAAPAMPRKGAPSASAPIARTASNARSRRTANQSQRSPRALISRRS